jgi:hypothetical protein
MTYKKLKTLLAALQRVIAYKFTREEALDILNVDDDILGNPDALKSAYRKAALKNHPDRGGDPEMMKKVNVAYDTLLKEEPITEDDVNESVVNSIIKDLRKEQKLTPSIKKAFKDASGMEPVGYAPKAEFLLLSKHKSMKDFAEYWGIKNLIASLDLISSLSDPKFEVKLNEFEDVVPEILKRLEIKNPALFSKIVSDMITLAMKGEDFLNFAEEYYLVDNDKDIGQVKDWDSFKGYFDEPYIDMTDLIYWDDGSWAKFFEKALKETLEKEILNDISSILEDDDDLLYLVTPLERANGQYVVGLYLDEIPDELADLDGTLKEVISEHLNARFFFLNTRGDFFDLTLAREAIKDLV